MSQSKVLMILGMHRSGTSVVTQWLHSCGLNVGDRLLGAGTGNIEGHFEDCDFLEYHEQLFLNRQLPDDGFFTQQPADFSKEEMDDLDEVLSQKNEVTEWGWKDPRTCLLLPLYEKKLPGSFKLIIFRNYTEVVSSLVQRRYKTDLQKYSGKNALRRYFWRTFQQPFHKKKLCRKKATHYLVIWMHYNRILLNAVQQWPLDFFFITDCNALRSESSMVLSLLVKHWGFHLNFTPFTAIYKPSRISEQIDLEKFISPSLRAEAETLQQQMQDAMQKQSASWKTMINNAETGYIVK